jgi:arylsulfatase A-like enzyme
MPKPNLLFIFTDEQRADTLAAYGNSRIRMPNLNRLAGQSVVFEQAYVTEPICTPSRSSLLTGLYPHANGCTANNFPLKPETPCFAEMLDPAYTTGYYGKWHLGDEIFPQHGFQHWRSIEDDYSRYYSPGRDRAARSTYHAFLIENGFQPDKGGIFSRWMATMLPEPFGKPAYLAREACRFIEENKDNPFALFVNFLEPHMPFTSPRDWDYSPDEISLPENFDFPPTAEQPLKTRFYYDLFRTVGHHGKVYREESDWRGVIARYWGLCGLVDTYAGAILSALELYGLAENTIVVFTSDHGDMMGSHRLLTKGMMFEEAARVPMTVRLPGQRAGRRIRGPVSQIDLLPTLLDLMEQPAPPHVQGKSLRPALEANAARMEEDVFIEWNGDSVGSYGEKGKLADELASTYDVQEVKAAIEDPIRTVITPDGWKLNWSAAGEHELYNLNDDPLETINLASRPDMRPRLEELHGRIRKWQERTGDSR